MWACALFAHITYFVVVCFMRHLGLLIFMRFILQMVFSGFFFQFPLLYPIALKLSCHIKHDAESCTVSLFVTFLRETVTSNVVQLERAAPAGLKWGKWWKNMVQTSLFWGVLLHAYFTVKLGISRLNLVFHAHFTLISRNFTRHQFSKETN